MNSKELIQTETIRQEIFALSKENFKYDVMLERARSFPYEQEEASRKYKENFGKINLLEVSLNKLVIALKKEKPGDFKTWVGCHIEICNKIIREAEDADSTRVFVANETLALWKDVLNGEMNFVIPNVSYLYDYDTFFNKEFGRFYHTG